jgi:hypothetical protein
MNRAGTLLILLAAMIVLPALAFAQPYAVNLFFSEYVEGSSNNKAIEIFNGTGASVDLSQYTVKLASNGGTWSTTNIITPTGTLAHNDVFVIANSQASAAILGVSDVTSTVTYFNGDDALGLFQGDTMIDIIGIYQNDPGTAWDVAGVTGATLNHTLVRKSTVVSGNLDWTAAAGTNADDGEWIVHDIDYVANLGMHTFEPGTGNNVATPTFNPGGGTYASPVSVTISCVTPNSSIFYTTDGSTPTPGSTPYTAPITISAATTLKAMATAPGMDPSNVATAVYSFPVAVPSLTVLRSMPADGTTVYFLDGEVILTFQQAFRNQKYLQDDGAGILIDDLNGIISTAYSVGDGIEGLTGKISEYAGMLQFVPTANGPLPSSSNNPIVPIVVDYGQLLSSFDTYESRVVKIMGVSFVAPTGNFANGTVYATYDQDNDYNIRTTFYDVDYINTPIPAGPKNITGIPNSRTDGAFFTPRALADFEDPAGTVAAPVFNPAPGFYNSPIQVSMTSATPGAQIHYTMDGSTPSESSTLYSNPVTIAGSTTTLKAIAILNGMPPSAVTTGVYSFPVSVPTLLALRQSPTGAIYRVNGNVVVSFTQDYRHQKFVQDATAGILIDDPNGIITTTYQTGDAIFNLQGTLSEFGGMLQLVPTVDPGAPSSTGNEIVPIPLLLEDFNTNFEDYESRVVRVMNARFSDPSGDFANGMVYTVTDQNNANPVSFRTSFYDVSYIGIPVYPDLINFSAIPNSRTEGLYLTARDWWDFQLSEVKAPSLDGIYVPEHPNTVYLSTIFDWYMTIPEGLTGYKLYRNGVLYLEYGPAFSAEWTDSPQPQGTYTYYATAMFGTTESEPSNSFVHITTPNPENPPAAIEIALLGNYPNPFNPSTSISFQLKEAGPVRMDIYNQKGQLLRTLLNATKAPGLHSVTWDGRDAAGNPSASGIYLYRLSAGSYTSTRKMLMLK